MASSIARLESQLSRQKPEADAPQDGAAASGEVGRFFAADLGGDSGGNPFDFQLSQDDDTSVTVKWGNVMLKGTFFTACTSWTDYNTGADLALSAITDTTYCWIAINLAAPTISWNTSTAGWGTADATTLIFKVATITCADDVITGIVQHQMGAINVPGNV